MAPRRSPVEGIKSSFPAGLAGGRVAARRAIALVAGCPGQSRSAVLPPSTPSFASMFVTWYFTASRLVPRRRAISLRLTPWRSQRGPPTRRESGRRDGEAAHGRGAEPRGEASVARLELPS